MAPSDSATLTRATCLKFYGVYGPLKLIALAIGILLISINRKGDIDEFYGTQEQCLTCFNDASSNSAVLFEFGKCSKDYSAQMDPTQHSNLIRSYPWLRGPAGRSSGVYLYLVHASLALVALVACAVVLVLFGWVFDNWKWSDHQIIFEVGLWAAFVTSIEGITLSRLYQASQYHECYIGAYAESVFVANWALVIILVSVFVMFEFVNWCCARHSTAFVQEKSCRVATAITMGVLAGGYAIFGIAVVATNAFGQGSDWICLALTVLGFFGVGETVFIYWYFPPSHGAVYEAV